MEAVEAAESGAGPSVLERLRNPSWAGSVGLIVVACGWMIGVQTLDDNSFLTHLATGRIILDTGRVPSHDPYTFTAAGEPWVVQSWLVSVVHASAERLGGLDAVRLVTAATAALLAGLGWSLLRPVTGLVVRVAYMGVFLAVGVQLWAERPFMVGLVCLAFTALAMDDRLDPRWLLPIGVIWVNSHGSFPLGFALLVVAGLGTWLDGGRPATEVRCLLWSAGGVVLGSVFPLGIKALVFPIELLSRQDILENVIEWRAPTFDNLGQRAFVLQLVIAIVALTRRPSYRRALLAAAFTAAALLSARNLVVASLVLLPAAAPGLDGIGSLLASARPAAARMLGIVAVAGLLVGTVVRLDARDLDLDRYPIAALAYLEEQQIDTREVHLASLDIAGNVVDYVYGPEGRTFYDDRFDMFPDEITAAHLALAQAQPRLQEDLDELEIDLVAVKTGSPSAQILTGSEVWRSLYLDGRWVLLCRRGATLSASADC